MIDVITVTIKDACRASGLGRTTIYEAIKNNELQPIKIGRRTLLRIEQLKAWLENNAA